MNYLFRNLLILCLLLTGTFSNAQENESTYCLVNSTSNSDLKPGQASFRIHVETEKGKICKEILLVDNGVEKHLYADEKGFITHITTPGKHSLTFVMGDSYFPIVTDNLYSIENYQINMEVVFKSSVLITYKEVKNRKQ